VTASDSTFITRVVLKNYKSIAACDVRLGPLTFLVGPNGSGKSNFIDALRFVSDALSTSLDHAIRERGGINEVRRRSGGHPTHFGIRLEFRLGDDARGHYAFRISALKNGGYEVQDEECEVIVHSGLQLRLFGHSGTASFRAKDGRVAVDDDDAGPAPRDRLYLPIAPSEDFGSFPGHSLRWDSTT
jgi:predicted ATPase